MRSVRSQQKERARNLELTARQVAVCKLLARGLGDKQIAAELGITEHGVRKHLGRLFCKARVQSRLCLVMWFLWLSPEAVRRLEARERELD